MMILPDNGKVVVFDDQQKDIESLLRALSKEKIPFLYYQDENGEDLPDEPLENVRLVFLDLELITTNLSSHNIIAPVAARLKKVLTKNNTYVLIYWSTKEDVYRKDLEEAFENGLKEYKPTLILSLKKAEANNSPNPAQFVIDALTQKVEAFSSLNAFMLWESSVNNAAGKITNSLTSIFKKDENWDKNMYNLLFQLARAQSGRDIVKGLSNSQKLLSAFELINNNLLEGVEKEFQIGTEKSVVKDIKEGGMAMSPEEIIKLNTRLHLSASDNLNHFYSGNLFIKRLNGLGREIIARNFKESKIEALGRESAELICLDITPSCDYSQEKNYSRILFGVKVSTNFSHKDLKDGDYRYKICPPIELDNPCYIFFDFRCLRSFSKQEYLYFFPESPKFRLRSGILLDIQAQLSNHVNRPGIVSV